MLNTKVEMLIYARTHFTDFRIRLDVTASEDVLVLAAVADEAWPDLLPLERTTRF